MALDVLIVDDSAAIRKILHRVLAQTDIALGDVLEAGDGVEALAVLEARRMSRICSPTRVPPGSRVALTLWPRFARYLMSRLCWVLLPVPSIPSSVIKRPRFFKMSAVRDWFSKVGC